MWALLKKIFIKTYVCCSWHQHSQQHKHRSTSCRCWHKWLHSGMGCSGTHSGLNTRAHVTANFQNLQPYILVLLYFVLDSTQFFFFHDDSLTQLWLLRCGHIVYIAKVYSSYKNIKECQHTITHSRLNARPDCGQVPVRVHREQGHRSGLWCYASQFQCVEVCSYWHHDDVDVLSICIN